MTTTTHDASNTTAFEIAELFGHDGRAWKLSDGHSLDTVCRDCGAEVEKASDPSMTAYRFRDGSAIIAMDSGWDVAVGSPACSCGWCCLGGELTCAGPR